MQHERRRALGAALLMAVTLAPAPRAVRAQEADPAAWSAGVYLATDYIYRGISQSQHHPVWQADVEYGGEQGPYAGAFASRVDYSEPGQPDDGLDTELTWRLGWRTPLGDVLALDTSLQYVTYPGADGDYEYLEIESSLALGEHAALRAMQAKDYFGFGGSVRDYGVDATWRAHGLDFTASAGYFDQRWLADAGYAYTELLASRAWGGWRIEAGWSRTFGYDAALEEANGPARLARPQARVTLAREF